MKGEIKDAARKAFWAFLAASPCLRVSASLYLRRTIKTEQGACVTMACETEPSRKRSNLP